jgi:hypothetical protein
MLALDHVDYHADLEYQHVQDGVSVIHGLSKR